jgi:uncharacterized protein YndB with AHSA1/START domain
VSRARVRLERTYAGASIDEAWALWTTKRGIEAWWGPPGFHVEVRSIDLRVGGTLAYAMIADAEHTIAFMKQHGMPVVTECRLVYTAIVAPTQLAYVHAADFVPGVAPYDVATEVALEATADGVRLVLTFDPMHDDTWTQRQTQGWELELGKLGGVLARTV